MVAWYRSGYSRTGGRWSDDRCAARSVLRTNTSYTAQSDVTTADRIRSERGHAAKKAARQKAARAQDLSDEHSRYNLQVNRAIRKKQKTDKKKARKGGLI